MQEESQKKGNKAIIDGGTLMRNELGYPIAEQKRQVRELKQNLKSAGVPIKDLLLQNKIHNAQLLSMLVSAREAAVSALQAAQPLGGHMLVQSCRQNVDDLLDIVETARLLLRDTQSSEDAQQCTNGGELLRSETSNSGYVGVAKRGSGNYVAALLANKRQLDFGTYPTAIAAAEAIQWLHNLTPVEKVRVWEKRKSVAVEKRKSDGGVLRSETNNSGYVGVTKSVSGNYVAQLNADKRVLNFGTYPTAIAAAEAIQSLHNLTPVEKVREWDQKQKESTIAELQQLRLEAKDLSIDEQLLPPVEDDDRPGCQLIRPRHTRSPS